MEINIKVFYMLILSFLVSMTRHAQSTQNKKFFISLQYLQKNMEDEVDFLPSDKKKNFYWLIISLWLSIGRHSQSTQNNKFAISFLYLKENLKDEVDFLPAVKHQRLLQIDTFILVVWGQACPTYPK